MAFSERTGSKIEIFIRCSQLVNLDYLTKSDPLCVLYTKHEELWSECGRTEVINDTLDPQVNERRKRTAFMT